MMAILKAGLEPEAVDAAVSKIEDLIKKNGGTIDSIDRWGKRKLAYQIMHETEGNYAVFYFQGENPTVKELDRVMRIDDNVLRFGILRRPEKVAQEA